MSESRLLVYEPWLYAKDVHANMRHLIDVLGFEHWFDEDSPDVGGGSLLTFSEDLVSVEGGVATD